VAASSVPSGLCVARSIRPVCDWPASRHSAAGRTSQCVR